MSKYLIIEKNTMSRESLSGLIYELENDSIVYEKESLNQSIDTPECYEVVDYVIFNLTYDHSEHTNQLLELKKLTPKSKILLVVKNTEHINTDSLFEAGVNAVITINSSKNEVIAAIRSLKIDQPYIGQHVLRSTDNTDLSETSEKLPLLKNRFASEIKNKLTNRQCEVLDYMTKGYANKLIAYELGVSEGTIKLHVSSILRALKVTNRTEAAMRAGQMMNANMHYV